MPRLVAKVEGRGNGIKTNVVNIGEISKSLKRPPTYLTKFLGIELGANNKFEAAEEKAIINGAFEQQTLQKLVDRYIEMYVVCPHCALPELDIDVVQSLVTGRCNACGHGAKMNNQHKLATYIVRNPPGKETSTMGKKPDGKERRSRKSKGASSEDVTTCSDGLLLTDEKEKERKKEKKEKKDKDKKKSSDKDKDKDGGGEKEPKKSKSKSKERLEVDNDGGGSDGGGECDDDDGGGESLGSCNTPKDKKGKKEKSKTKVKGQQAMNATDENIISYTFDSPELWPLVITRLKHYVVSNMVTTGKTQTSSSSSAAADKATDNGSGKADTNNNGNASTLKENDEEKEEEEKDENEAMNSLPKGLPTEYNSELADDFRLEVRRLQVSQVFSHEVRLFVGFNALLSGRFTKEHLAKVVPYIMRLVDSAVSDSVLCNAAEKFYYHRKREGNIDAELAYPIFLNVLYQGELLDEEAILKFYSITTSEKKSKENDDIYKEARIEAKPFLDFLRGSDDEDNEEDEVSLDTQRARGGSSCSGQRSASDDGDGDDDDEQEEDDGSPSSNSEGITETK